MGSLDIGSLFTNIPPEETMNICTNLLYNNEDVIEGMNKNLLSLSTQESYVIFNDVLYKQKNDVAMGSLLGSTMTNVFLLFNKVKWLERNLNQLCIEDTFLFYSNRLSKSQSFVIVFMFVIQTCLFSLNKKKKLKVVISWNRSILGKKNICYNCL